MQSSLQISQGASRAVFSRARDGRVAHRHAAPLAVTAKAQKVTESAEAAVAAEPAKPAVAPSPAVNVIQPISRWPEGIPPAMGGHFMPSAGMAPLAQSKGPGVDIRPLDFTYPAGGFDVAVSVYDNDFAASAGLADLVAAASAEAVASKGSFTIALSGGSLLKALAGLVGREGVDFSKWWVLFVDERNVAHASPDSNLRGAQEALLRRVPVPSSQVLALREGLPVAQAAAHYEGLLLDLDPSVLPRTADGFPAIDLVLLGVGPDGHVASLFPNRAAVSNTSDWVVPVTNSPKPPAERITVTVPVLNAAKQVAVVALGAGKAEVVQRALEVQTLPGALPVQLVQPQSGKLTWVLDKAAAHDLRINDWAAGTKRFPRSGNPVGEAAAPAEA